MASAALGRDVHVLSTIERDAAVLALYCPRLLDLLEQRLLDCGPGAHVLSSHPSAVGLKLPAFSGTVQVAARLGLLPMHPVITVEKERVPYPLLGDLLLCMVDETGPYCVNWTVKSSDNDFDRPACVGQPSRDPQRAAARTRARHVIEEQYYLDAGIPTKRVTASTLDFDVRCNLLQLFGWHGRKVDISADDRLRAIDRFRAGITLKVPPLETMIALAVATCRGVDTYKAVLFQAIWTRELRVDLWSPILIDKPLRAEVKDVLDVHADLFGRT